MAQTRFAGNFATQERSRYAVRIYLEAYALRQKLYNVIFAQGFYKVFFCNDQISSKF